MMRIYVILNMLFLIIFSCGQNSENITIDKEEKNEQRNLKLSSEIEINIINSIVAKNEITIEAVLVNKTKEKIFIPVITDYSIFVSECLKKYYPTPFFYLKITDTNEKIVHSKCDFVTFHPPEEEKQLEDMRKFNSLDSTLRSEYPSILKDMPSWGVRYKLLKEQSVYLQPKDSALILIKKKIDADVYSQNITWDISRFDIKDLNKRNVEIRLMSDSSQIKRDLLLPKDIDSLRKNNIQIFHGTISSKKMPLRFE